MQRLSLNWDTALIAAIVALAGVCTQTQAQEGDNIEDGKVVQIAPGQESEQLREETRVVEEPRYWIGVRGTSIDSAILRTHLQLADDMGVVVEEVIEDSPADNAGLRRHDIILRCNGDAVDNMRVLQSQVASGKDKPLELKIVRLGKQETLVVVPEVRPEQVTGPPRRRELGLEADPMQQLLERFGARNIGPGMVFRGGGQQFDFNQIPNGVSVSIQRNNDQPVQITVKQGDKTWQIEGDDAESLEQLPDDLRPFVERMLRGQPNLQGFEGGIRGGFDLGDLDAQLREVLPRNLGDFGPQGDALRRQFEQREKRTQQREQMIQKRMKQAEAAVKQQEDKIQQRMRQLEKQLKQLQQRFEEGGTALPE